ncbi:MAG: hypothetical protein PQJ59_13295 [Spirochaetales bacterium]|nr:hypothetical protein [Spirochaetales bacterium]
MREPDSLKNYFSHEVEQSITPPFPGETEEKKTSMVKDNIITAVAAAVVFLVILFPGAYDNRLRKSHMTRESYKELQEIPPYLVYSSIEYFQDQINKKEFSL